MTKLFLSNQKPQEAAGSFMGKTSVRVTAFKKKAALVPDQSIARLRFFEI